ncbi:MAG TPA: lactate racemase domain-containing protein, partial [Armatimonadota bacterium]|nr:lactate racemase domain-containing protein [Armatimonadota bacterium]
MTTVLDRDKEALKNVELMILEQDMPSEKLDDPAAAMREAVCSSGLPARIKPGMSVCIGAGSRGIANMPIMLRTVAEIVREQGAEPFFIPAMGSHGGATAGGQLELLGDLGVTVESVGAPIRATMDTVQLGETPQGVPVFMDRYAAAADGV